MAYLELFNSIVQLFGSVEKLASFVAIITFIIFLWAYRDRVLLALTGDDHLHQSFLGFIWWFFFHCCGTCDGSCFVTCCGLSSNPVKWLGKKVGVAHQSIEIKNIVVGDLPFANSYGDFFIEVSCAENPSLVTSLAEEKSPKVVHFPEVLTLRTRNHWLEQKIHIIVKELNVLGSENIAEVKIPAMNAVDWATAPVDWNDKNNDNERIKRFQMTGLTDIEPVTPPWILLEFSEPTSDHRQLDTWEQTHHMFNHTYMRVRTLTGGNPKIPNNTTWKSGLMTGKPVEDVHEWAHMGDFKEQYVLVDSAGGQVEEPDEMDLASLSRTRNSLDCLNGICTFLIVLAFFSIGCIQFYLWSCWRQIEFLTIARLQNENSTNGTVHFFPMSLHEIRDMTRACVDDVRGAGYMTGTVPCKPSARQINETDWGGVNFTHGRDSRQDWDGRWDGSPQPRPRAFAHLQKQLFEQEIWAPRTCQPGVINRKINWDYWQKWTWIGWASLIPLKFVARLWCNCFVRSESQRKQKQRGKDRKDGIDEMKKKKNERKLKDQRSLTASLFG